MGGERVGVGEEEEEEGKCLYEILGVPRDASQDEIRSSYKRLALQLHPDKLISSGVPEPQATASFQSLLHAYQTLSNPRDRSIYDSRRSQIIFQNPNSTSHHHHRRLLVDTESLLPFFSNSAFSGFSDSSPTGFYAVYADLFSRLHAQELHFARSLSIHPDAVGQAPLFGDSRSPSQQFSAFYSYWLSFSTVLDFSWLDPWAFADISAAPVRKARRLMEDENKKARKKARREFNETVRALAEFVKKKDKRVVEMMKRKSMDEAKRRAKEVERKKEELRAKMERARRYKEPDWAKAEEVEVEDEEEEESEELKKENELYCVVCGKKFKSEKQWKNHEQSKKHQEKVAELKVSFEREAKKNGDEGDEEEMIRVSSSFEEVGEDNVDDDIEEDDSTRPRFVDKEVVEDNVDELCEEFEDCVGVGEEESGLGIECDENDEFNNGNKGSASAFVESDDEASILEAMISGHKNKKNVYRRGPEATSAGRGDGDDDGDEPSFMEYDTRKPSRRNRGAKKGGGNRNMSGGADTRTNTNGVDEGTAFEGNGNKVKDDDDDVSCYKESSKNSFVETSTAISGDGSSNKNRKSSKQSSERKGVEPREAYVKIKSSSKGKKQKATKTSGLACETCGETFESRNKLHMHLGSTGHAVVKFR